jgi:hypothetical protein
MLQSPFHSVGLAGTYGIGEAPYTSPQYPASPILPFGFGRRSVDTDTRKNVPLQIYHLMAVVSCCVYLFGAGKFWAVYQILDRKKVLT